LANPSSLAAKLPFLVILTVAVVGALAFREQLSFEALARHREALILWRDAHPVTAPMVFVAAYAALVALSLPGATVATLTGGFLFGTFPGVLWNASGATLGAIGIFLAARSGFGAGFAARLEGQGGRVARLQAALLRNEWSVLFLMRLAPVVPFFLANLIPAFLNIRLSRFAVTTALGILPGALVFTSVGAGLGEVFARGAMPDLSVLSDPAILLPLLGLCALAALPIFLKARLP
jgi:uncharacterized membrane protein YdjX (TVP38/TMEM64 family)